MQRQEMFVDVEVTEQDVVAFHKHYVKTSPPYQRNFRIGVFSGAISIAVLTFVFSNFSLTAMLWFALPTIAIFIPLMYHSHNSAINKIGKQMREAGKNKGLFCRHIITISPEGVIEKTSVNESASAWQGIEKVDEMESHIFIYTNSNSAHIIAKRYFPNGEDAMEFYRLSKLYWETKRA